MKKQLTGTLYFSLLIICESFSQSMFQKTIGGTSGDYCYSVSLTFDGGYIFCGNSGSFGGGGSDVYLVKTDANGDTLWTRTYGTTDQDYGHSVVQTTDSGYIISGRTGVSPTHNVYLIKTDAVGDTLWTKIIGGAAIEDGASVVQSSDGGFAVIGSTTSFGAGFNDLYMIKTNASGDTLWTRTFGEAGNDYGHDLQQTHDGGFIIAGTVSDVSFNHNVLLLKTDSSGNILWSKVFGDYSIDLGYAVDQTHDNGFVVAGHTTGSAPGDAYIIKTDSAGNLQWSKSFGGAYPDYAEDVEQTADNGYILSGRTQSFGVTGIDVYLVKMDSTGNLQWSKTYGDTVSAGMVNDGTTSARQTSDGGYIIGGYTNSFGSGDMDMFVIKTDANGNSICHQGNPPTNVNTFPTIVSIYPLVTGSGSTIFSASPIAGNGGTALTLCTSVGINETTGNNSILVFPNPSTGSLSIASTNIINDRIVQVYNIFGVKVFEEYIINSSEKEINLSTISSGIYFVKVFNAENYYCKKIIIERD